MKNHSGQESKTYICNGSRIEVLPYFLYELNIYKYWENGVCVLESRFFKLDKPLDIKHYSKFKKGDDCLIEKEITLLGAPLQFIRENKLSEYKPNCKTKKLRKNETVR